LFLVADFVEGAGRLMLLPRERGFFRYAPGCWGAVWAPRDGGTIRSYRAGCHLGSNEPRHALLAPAVPESSVPCRFGCCSGSRLPRPTTRGVSRHTALRCRETQVSTVIHPLGTNCPADLTLSRQGPRRFVGARSRGLAPHTGGVLGGFSEALSLPTFVSAHHPRVVARGRRPSPSTPH
jgi:hypothetical protein